MHRERVGFNPFSPQWNTQSRCTSPESGTSSSTIMIIISMIMVELLHFRFYGIIFFNKFLITKYGICECPVESEFLFQFWRIWRLNLRWTLWYSTWRYPKICFEYHFTHWSITEKGLNQGMLYFLLKPMRKRSNSESGPYLIFVTVATDMSV